MTTGAGLRPTAKVVDEPPDPTVRAPQIYPDGAADKAANLVGCKSPHRQLLGSDG
jgi:hypothetical protein